MQIDFHHTVTYVAARFAGFGHEDAEIIAYASQYVDDATNSGTIHFDNGAMYTRISSAHPTVDPVNLDNTSNHLVWLPFHFLPGNGGLAAGQDPDGKFIEKILCRPGNQNPIAQDMVACALEERGKPGALQRLGITLHVYADTWAHQGFAGVLHPVNDVNEMEDTGHSGVFPKEWVTDLLGHLVPPLGHGRAQVFPDMPFLSWRYENGRKEILARSNTETFLQAADAMCRVMQRYRHVDPVGLPSTVLDKIRTLFTRQETCTAKAEDRHQVWLEALGADAFGFGAIQLSYHDDGEGSWKAQALGSSEDQSSYPYSPAFLQSPWKRFHDALQQHRLTLLHQILPNYGICAG